MESSSCTSSPIPSGTLASVMEMQQQLIADLNAITTTIPILQEADNKPVNLVKEFGAESNELKKCIKKVIATYLIAKNSNASETDVAEFKVSKKALKEKRNSLYENYLYQKRSIVKKLAGHPNFRELIDFVSDTTREINNCEEKSAITQKLQNKMITLNSMIRNIKI